MKTALLSIFLNWKRAKNAAVFVQLANLRCRDAVLKLEAHGLATFRKTNQGTIAVLTNTAIFDINSELEEREIKACIALEKEPNYSHAKTIQQPFIVV